MRRVETQFKTCPEPMNCTSCPMLASSEWHVLKELNQARLSKAKVVQSFAKGGVIFHQGTQHDGIYCVQSGMVGLRKTDEKGNAVLLNLIYPGQTVGMPSFFAGSEYMASAEALAPTTVCFIPGPVLTELVANNPELDLEFLKHISRDLSEAYNTILANTSQPVRMRMAHFLLSLKDRCGIEQEAGKVVLELPITRNDIADLLSTRPETIARTITALTKDGLVAFKGRKAVLLDLEALYQESEPVES
ncbi:MAG: Crp/Fnr family transcriptional regulator [bacterium]